MAKEKKAPNCYDCKWRGILAGSAHSSCKHPKLASILSDPTLSFLSIMASVGRTPPMALDALGVTGEERGITGGWFNWPWNFDPIWLKTCDGFEKKGGDESAKRKPEKASAP